MKKKKKTEGGFMYKILFNGGSKYNNKLCYVFLFLFFVLLIYCYCKNK